MLYFLRRAARLRAGLVGLLCLAFLGCPWGADAEQEPPPPPDRASRMRALAEKYRAQLEALAGKAAPPRVTLGPDGDVLDAAVDSLAVAARAQPVDEDLVAVRSLAEFKAWFAEKTEGKDWDALVQTYRDAADTLAVTAPAPPDAGPLRRALDTMLARNPPEERAAAARELRDAVDAFDGSVRLYLGMLSDLRGRTERAFAPVGALIAKVEALGEENWPPEAARVLMEEDFVAVCAGIEELHQGGLNTLAETIALASEELEAEHAALAAKVDALRDLLDDAVVEEADDYVEESRKTIDDSKKVLETIAEVSTISATLALAFAINPLLGLAALVALFAMEMFGDGGDGDGGEGSEDGPAGDGAEQSAGPAGEDEGAGPSGPPPDGHTTGMPGGTALPRAPDGTAPGGVGSTTRDPRGPWFETWLAAEEFGMSLSGPGVMSGLQLILRPDGGPSDSSVRWVLGRFHAARDGQIPQIRVAGVDQLAYPITVTFEGINKGDQSLTVTWSDANTFTLGELFRD